MIDHRNFWITVFHHCIQVLNFICWMILIMIFIYFIFEKSAFCPIICFFSFDLIALNACSIGAISGVYACNNLSSNWDKLNIDFNNFDEWIDALSSCSIYLSWDLFRFNQIKLSSIFRNNKKIEESTVPFTIKANHLPSLNDAIIKFHFLRTASLSILQFWLAGSYSFAWQISQKIIHLYLPLSYWLWEMKATGWKINPYRFDFSGWWTRVVWMSPSYSYISCNSSSASLFCFEVNQYFHLLQGESEYH